MEQQSQEATRLRWAMCAAHCACGAFDVINDARKRRALSPAMYSNAKQFEEAIEDELDDARMEHALTLPAGSRGRFKWEADAFTANLEERIAQSQREETEPVVYRLIFKEKGKNRKQVRRIIRQAGNGEEIAWNDDAAREVALEILRGRPNYVKGFLCRGTEKHHGFAVLEIINGKEM